MQMTHLIFENSRIRFPIMKITESSRRETPAPHLSRLPDALWICGQCPYFSVRLSEEGRCPLCVALMIGQCKCGSVVMGRDEHSCGNSEMALGIIPMPRAAEWPAFRYAQSV